MTIKELYEWAVSQNLEDNPIKFFKGNTITDIRSAELITENNPFNGVIYEVEVGMIILR